MRFLTLAILLIFYSSSAISSDRETSFSEKPNCEKQSGVWRQFGNSCVDNCRPKFDQFSICAQAITYGCDCLQDKCHDDGKCVLMDDYKVKYDEIVEKRKEQLKYYKEIRKDEFLANRQAILQRIIAPPNPEGQDGNSQNNTNNNGVANNNNNIQNNNNSSRYTANDPNIAKSPNYIDNSAPIELLIKPAISTDDNFQVPPFFSQAQEQAVKKVEEEERLKQQQNDDGLALPQVPINQ